MRDLIYISFITENVSIYRKKQPKSRSKQWIFIRRTTNRKTEIHTLRQTKRMCRFWRLWVTSLESKKSENSTSTISGILYRDGFYLYQPYGQYMFSLKISVKRIKNYLYHCVKNCFFSFIKVSLLKRTLKNCINTVRFTTYG